ncbi:metallophosphoesterase [Micromonospora sp. KLBMP9576]|uniref:metallophosphoesterase n=1 Tax=Micromonospora sp. KLBMP9576 TaxID=3424769 RepID=UPI003D8C7F15
MPLRLDRRSLLLGAAATAAAPALSTFLPSAALAADATAVGGNSRESFTIAVLPDTQHSMKSFPASFTTQLDWILNQRNTYWRVRYAIHVGDLVHNATDTTQWARARDGIARLDNRVPLAIAPGNHDFNNVDTRNLTTYNTYVPYSKFNAQRTAGGSAADLGAYPSTKTNNTWHQFTAGGTDWAIITLSFDPTAAELAWARSVVAAHPSKQFIVSTHNYMTAGTGQRNATGENMWNNLVKLYPNIFMVLCGHSYTGGPKRKFSIGDNGNRVEEILADFQNADDPVPNSYLRIMQFHPTAGTIVVKTYSPRYNTFLTDAQNQFTLTNIPFPLRAPQVKRHILNPDILAAWHLTGSDYWFLPPAEAAKFPAGAVLNFRPTVLQVSGTTGLFVLDRGYKRHIAGSRAYQAWRFAAGDRKVITAEEMAAYPAGPIWPRYPHLVRAEGATAVYFLDTPFP